MGATIEIDEAEVTDLRCEVHYRRTLHQKSMQREAELKEELRDRKQTIRELRAEGEAKDEKIQEQAARIEWLENQFFGRSTEQRDHKRREDREEKEKTPKESHRIGGTRARRNETADSSPALKVMAGGAGPNCPPKRGSTSCPRMSGAGTGN